MNTLETKTKDLLMLRAEISKIDEEYERQVAPLKVLRDKEQFAIMEELKSSGQFSVRFATATVSLSVRKTLKVINENEVIEELKSRGLDKEYTAVKLNDLFKEFSKTIVKEGTPIKGTEISETEFISIRATDEKVDKRKVKGDFIK